MPPRSVGKLRRREPVEGGFLLPLIKTPQSSVDANLETPPTDETNVEASEADESLTRVGAVDGMAKVDKSQWDEVLLEDFPFTTSYEVCMVQTASDGRPFLPIAIKGVRTSALLDSGAAVSVMSEKFFNELHEVDLRPSETRLRAANGGRMTVVGECDLGITVGKTTTQLLVLVVTATGHDVILGCDMWRAAGWTIAGVNPTHVACMDQDPGVKVNIETELSKTQQKLLLEAVKGFVVGDSEVLTQTHVLEHTIELEPGSRPFILRSHHFSPALEAKMHTELERMLRMGVIEPSSSPVASPIVPQVKKDGTTRLCLDSRVLNSMTVKDRYPVPNLSAIVGRLRAAKWYVAIDLKSAFWQVNLSPVKQPGQFASSREYTAFIFPGRGLFQFKVMPFGLCNSPATQCRLMQAVLRNDLEPSVVVYLDDVLIMGNTFEETLSRLKEVIRRLADANLAVNLNKCKFFCQEIVFLGFFIGHGEIRPDPNKVKAITGFPTPKTVKEVRRFLGMAGYYRRMIPDFSGVTASLSDLLKGDAPFAWTAEAEEAFTKMKLILSSEPVVQNPRFELEFVLQCDASDVAAAGVLGQTHDGREVVIAYHSHKWQKFERHWGATEKEAAAVLYAIRHFRPFIAGAHFTVVTDAKALLHLKTVRTDGSSKLARWSLELNEYDLTIKHRKGVENVVADALSRAVEAFTTEVVDLDPWLAEMVAKISQQPHKYPDFRWEGRRLLKFESVDDDIGGYAFAWREYVPPAAREAVIDETHRQLQHVGWEKCLEVMRRQWFWPGQLPQVKQQIQACTVCLHCKRRPRNTRVPLGMSRNASSPFQIICIDHWGPVPRSASGNKFMLLVVDVLTKFVLLHPCRDAKARAVTNYLRDGVFSIFGVPETIISDNAKAFMGREMMGLLNEYNVDHWSTPVHHPQANMAERYIQTAGTAIRSLVFQEGGEHRTWDSGVPQIQAALNAVRSDATGQSPYKLLFGQEMVLNAREYRALAPRGTPRDELTDDELVSRFDEMRTRAKQALGESQAESRRRYDQTSQILKFVIGERVWRKNRMLSNAADGFSHKLAPKFLPAVVRETLGEDTYLLQDMAGGRPTKFHANDLFKDRPGSPQLQRRSLTD